MNIEQPGVGDPLFDDDVVLRKIGKDVYAWKVGWEGCWVRASNHTGALSALAIRASELNERYRAEQKAGDKKPAFGKKPLGQDESVLDPLLGPKTKKD